MDMRTPYIHVGKDSIEIIGDERGLMALATLIKAKVKLGKNLSALLNDGTNLPIHVTTTEEINDNLKNFLMTQK